MSNLRHWLWLSTRGPAPGMYAARLLEHFGTPEGAYFASEAAYDQVPDLPSKVRRALLDKDLTGADRILAQCDALDIRILTCQDAAYPQRLAQLDTAPCVLYVRGKLPQIDQEAAVAVVGARKASPYGVMAAGRMALDLARHGAVVVSGSAYGIDGAALRGALQGGGRVVSVLGNGIDVVYPPGHRDLYEDVAASGVLLSEYPPGAEPFGWHFPAWNRILSGLCLATLVVEAPEKSGALITAATALEQGRDVFAIPGPLDAEGSVGCNRLIRDGAGLATESWDILREYQSRYPHKLHPDGEKLPPLPKKSEIFYPERSKKPKVAPSGLPVINVRRNAEGLTDDQIKVLRILDDKEPMLTDDIALRANVPVRRILSAVTMLEIDGYTRQEGLRKFVRTVEVEDTKE